MTQATWITIDGLNANTGAWEVIECEPAWAGVTLADFDERDVAEELGTLPGEIIRITIRDAEDDIITSTDAYEVQATGRMIREAFSAGWDAAYGIASNAMRDAAQLDQDDDTLDAALTIARDAAVNAAHAILRDKALAETTANDVMAAINERVVSKSWTALINGGWKIMWMPQFGDPYWKEYGTVWMF